MFLGDLGCLASSSCSTPGGFGVGLDSENNFHGRHGCGVNNRIISRTSRAKKISGINVILGLVETTTLPLLYSL